MTRETDYTCEKDLEAKTSIKMVAQKRGRKASVLSVSTIPECECVQNQQLREEILALHTRLNAAEREISQRIQIQAQLEDQVASWYSETEAPEAAMGQAEEEDEGEDYVVTEFDAPYERGEEWVVGRLIHHRRALC